MYNYFEGKLDELNPAYAVIDCGGIGYLLEITLSTYEQLKNHTHNDNRTIRLYVHEAIREDAHQLFGFYDQNERIMFKLLIAVNGVGPASARMILSSMNASELQQAIASKDTKLLQRAKGIGAKTAQRIVLELQDKIELTGTEDMLNNIAVQNQNVTEASSALMMLGFAKPAIDKALRAIGHTADMSVEDIIKNALKNL